MGCERILLVEDDADLLDLMAEIIEQRGTEAVRCRDGASALERLREGPRPDLVLLDISMPTMTGAELLDVVRRHERWRTIPVVAISGFPARQFPGLRVDEFVSKPFDAAELEGVIDRLCGRKSSTAESAA